LKFYQSLLLHKNLLKTKIDHIKSIKSMIKLYFMKKLEMLIILLFFRQMMTSKTNSNKFIIMLVYSLNYLSMF